MSSIDPPEPLEVFPSPEGAHLLANDRTAVGMRSLAIKALSKELTQRRLSLPFGPQSDADNPARLLSLNRFAIQLVDCGMLADQISIPLDHWQHAKSAPQLLLATQVDEENAVVYFPGVLTGAEFIAAAKNAPSENQQLQLDIELFSGGLERLFTLVQLLDASLLPRYALNDATSNAERLIYIADWLHGQIDQALTELGAQMQPIAAAAFRGAASAEEIEQGSPLAVLSIPLGINSQGLLVSGDQARHAIEAFKLLLTPTSNSQSTTTPDGLILRLIGDIEGDLLPDGLSLIAEQGSHHQRATTNQSTELELQFKGPEQIRVKLQTSQGEPLELLPLQLPQP